MMEKLLVRWSYLLGLLCFAVSVIWRALNALSIGVPESLHSISYLSFFKAGAMFLLICIAAVNYNWFAKQEKF